LALLLNNSRFSVKKNFNKSRKQPSKFGLHRLT
jgi:hypothetical protein